MAVPDLGPRQGLTPRGLGRAAAAILLGLATGGLGCRGPVDPVIDEDVYVEVMAHLALAEARFFDDARADSARAATLERFGVSGADVVAFADRYGDDVGRMAEIFDRIRMRVDSLEAVPVPESAEREPEPSER